MACGECTSIIVRSVKHLSASRKLFTELRCVVAETSQFPHSMTKRHAFLPGAQCVHPSPPYLHPQLESNLCVAVIFYPFSYTKLIVQIDSPCYSVVIKVRDLC